jgi:hypothetical protein
LIGDVAKKIESALVLTLVFLWIDQGFGLTSEEFKEYPLIFDFGVLTDWRLERKPLFTLTLPPTLSIAEALSRT